MDLSKRNPSFEILHYLWHLKNNEQIKNLHFLKRKNLNYHFTMGKIEPFETNRKYLVLIIA